MLLSSSDHFVSRGSAPGAWAHAPLVHRLPDLKVPVTFIYGEHDWMRPEHAVKVGIMLRGVMNFAHFTAVRMAFVTLTWYHGS